MLQWAGGTPAPSIYLRTVHSAGARSGQQERHRVPNRQASNHNQQVTSLTAASLLAVQRWRREHAQAHRPASLASIAEPGDRSCHAVPAATGAEPPDLVAMLLGEPQVAIGPRRDAKGRAVGR